MTWVTADWFLWTPALSAARSALAGSLALGPRLPRELKAVLTSKHLIPLLEYCDHTGLTRRSGDQRTLAALKAVSDVGDATP